MAQADFTRREFLKTTAALSAASAIAPATLGRAAWAGGRDTLRIGVVGCGGRGTGAAVNALQAGPSTQIVAMADVFADRLDWSHRTMLDQEDVKDRVQVDPERMYTGFDACERLLANDDINYVILATPPGFRPGQFEAAIRAGKHVFFEKPVAVDPDGIRRVMNAGDLADEKGLSVVTGTQRRHEACYLEAMRRIRDGAIGDIVGGQCYWNQGGLWVHERQPQYSDIEWQIRNWLYFTWLSGDHIVEQHVHNLDVMNWVMGGPPDLCRGLGGRQVRVGPQFGNIFDHFAIEYVYPGGVSAMSTCRQIDGCDIRVEEVIRGTKGRLVTRSGYAEMFGDRPWRHSDANPNPYVVEHADLQHAIETGDRINEARRVAESTLTAIMGRMSCYTGKDVTWDQALNSSLKLGPSSLDVETYEPDAVAVPGRTRLE
ncbi:MAG: Gfo/Idh/MocA family oxidoreductase [Phycisphaeraceae bacterium]|nr:Gfo/Idh/MocA family oxidoreductase [Phycisphaeraceae bacterium]